MERRAPIYWADLKQSLRWACLVGGVLLTTVKMSVSLYSDHREALEAIRSEAQVTRAGVEHTKAELAEIREELRSLQFQLNELTRGKR